MSEKIMRCKDQVHRDNGTGRALITSYEKTHWCPFSRHMTMHDPQAMRYADDWRSMNWAMVCSITGKTVTANKKCDCLDEYNKRVPALIDSKHARWSRELHKRQDEGEKEAKQEHSKKL